jgi:hypothetical protein
MSWDCYAQQVKALRAFESATRSNIPERLSAPLWDAQISYSELAEVRCCCSTCRSLAANMNLTLVRSCRIQMSRQPYKGSCKEPYTIGTLEGDAVFICEYRRKIQNSSVCTSGVGWFFRTGSVAGWPWMFGYNNNGDLVVKLTFQINLAPPVAQSVGQGCEIRGWP